MNTSEKIDLILPALMKVKSKLQAVTKSANNPFFKSKYADLNTYLEEVEPLLEENKMVLFQPVKVNDLGINVVSSIIMHESGQFVSSEMVVVAKEADMQKMGSAITYARRYTLGPLLSMKAEDDDGNHAVGRTQNKTYNQSKVDSTTSEVKQTVSKESAQETTSTEKPSQLLNNRPSFKDRLKNKPEITAVSKAVVSSGDDI